MSTKPDTLPNLWALKPELEDAAISFPLCSRVEKPGAVLYVPAERVRRVLTRAMIKSCGPWEILKFPEAELEALLGPEQCQKEPKR